MLSKLLVAVSVVIVAWWITLCAPPSAGYNSIIRQSLHYFSRAGGGRVWEEIKHESAWTGAELSSDISRWRLELTSEQQKDILVVVAKLKGLNKKLTDIRKGDAEWPQWMLDTFNKTKFELSSGLGLAVIRGIPVNSMTEDEQQLFWWSVGFELGIPGAQDDDGNLLGHIRDVGGDPRTERQYKTKSHISFHNDGADLVGLLCLKEAKQGGTSRVISSTAVFNRLLKRLSKEDLELLYEPILIDTRGSGGINTFTVRPFAVNEAGHLQTFYHEDYFQSAYEYEDSEPPSDAIVRILKTYNEILREPGLSVDMDFLEGDIQLISNHVTLHSRTAFDDHPELEKRRHLLRLWVSLDGEMSTKDRINSEIEKLRIISVMVKSKVKNALFGGYGKRRSKN